MAQDDEKDPDALCHIQISQSFPRHEILLSVVLRHRRYTNILYLEESASVRKAPPSEPESAL